MERVERVAVYAISDTHFGHKNIIRYSDRPYKDLVDMENGMVANWNSMIQPEDVVIHCGDFALSSKDEITRVLGRLNGRIILVQGNHDNFSKSFYESSFYFFTHEPLKVRINGKQYIFSHFPPEMEDVVKHQATEFVFGHTHTMVCQVNTLKNCKNVSVELTNYRPVFIGYAEVSKNEEGRIIFN